MTQLAEIKTIYSAYSNDELTQDEIAHRQRIEQFVRQHPETELSLSGGDEYLDYYDAADQQIGIVRSAKDLSGKTVAEVSAQINDISDQD